MTPWDLPWPRVLKYMRKEHGIGKAEVMRMTDYELDCWMRPADQHMRRELDRRDARAGRVQELMRQRGMLPKRRKD